MAASAMNGANPLGSELRRIDKSLNSQLGKQEQTHKEFNYYEFWNRKEIEKQKSLDRELKHAEEKYRSMREDFIRKCSQNISVKLIVGEDEFIEHNEAWSFPVCDWPPLNTDMNILSRVLGDTAMFIKEENEVLLYNKNVIFKVDIRGFLFNKANCKQLKFISMKGSEYSLRVIDGKLCRFGYGKPYFEIKEGDSNLFLQEQACDIDVDEFGVKEITLPKEYLKSKGSIRFAIDNKLLSEEDEYLIQELEEERFDNQHDDLVRELFDLKKLGVCLFSVSLEAIKSITTLKKTFNKNGICLTSKLTPVSDSESLIGYRIDNYLLKLNGKSLDVYEVSNQRSDLVPNNYGWFRSVNFESNNDYFADWDKLNIDWKPVMTIRCWFFPHVVDVSVGKFITTVRQSKLKEYYKTFDKKVVYLIQDGEIVRDRSGKIKCYRLVKIEDRKVKDFTIQEIKADTHEEWEREDFIEFMTSRYKRQFIDDNECYEYSHQDSEDNFDNQMDVDYMSELTSIQVESGLIDDLHSMKPVVGFPHMRSEFNDEALDSQKLRRNILDMDMIKLTFMRVGDYTELLEKTLTVSKTKDSSGEKKRYTYQDMYQDGFRSKGATTLFIDFALWREHTNYLTEVRNSNVVTLVRQQ